MKKHLLALAALALTGCVHAQYKTSYLQEYSTYDCKALDLELLAAKEREGRIQEQKTALRRAIVFRSDSLYIRRSSDFFQAARMQVHAKQQAIFQLQASQGCRSADLLPSVNGTSNLRE